MRARAHLCSEEIAIGMEYERARETVAIEIVRVRLTEAGKEKGTETRLEKREGIEANTDVQRGAGVRTASAVDEIVLEIGIGIERETPGRHERRANDESKDYRTESGSCTGDESSRSFPPMTICFSTI